MPYYKTLFGIRLWYAKLFNRDALQKALVRACLAGRTEEAERMLDAGADPNKMGRLPGDPQNAVSTDSAMSTEVVPIGSSLCCHTGISTCGCHHRGQVC